MGGMREKLCLICQEQFAYKNRSKIYCSNACKQQALRNREKETRPKSFHFQQSNIVEISQVKANIIANDNELVFSLFNRYSKQIEAMCKGLSIHYTMLLFMRDLLNSLKDANITDPVLKAKLEGMGQLVKSLNQIAQRYHCELGYIIFRRTTSKQALNNIKRINNLHVEWNDKK